MIDTPPKWAALFDALGGRAAFANRLLVDESTVWRWSRGGHRPGRRVRDNVNALCDEHKLAHVFSLVAPRPKKKAATRTRSKRPAKRAKRATKKGGARA
jgi:hypothetical protein